MSNSQVSASGIAVWWLVALAALMAPASPVGAQSCATDINGDGQVNAIDLGMVLGTWGICGADVTGVSPQHGSTLGGTLITITGSALQYTTAVMIGGVPCTNLQVLSSTQVRALTPAGAIGEASITVESPQSIAWAPVPFQYVLQAIATVTPISGPPAGGTPITITGSYLAGATSVTVGGVPATSVVAVSATTVTAVTPAGSVGPVTVTVSTPKGTATAAGAFWYGAALPAWATLIEAAPDPAVVIDTNLRNAIIASGYAWRVRDTATQIEMLLVPPGTFSMGCSASTRWACTSAENPVHTVTLTNAFYMARYEVTQAQWQAKMGSNPSYFSGYADSPSRPVEQVSWTTIQGFLSATGMRLPTEAEWEYSCRAGTTTAFHSGPGFPNGTDTDSLAGDIAWYYLNSGNQTHVVGGKAGNALGLHDMSGNVYEWVCDWFRTYPSAAQVNPTGPTSGSHRVLRGGAWYDLGSYALRSSYRGGSTPGLSSGQMGFRVARSP